MISKGIVYFKLNGWTAGRYFSIKKDIMGISTMNSTINNNRKLLKNGKRVPFTKMNRGSSKQLGYKQYVMPEVPPHILRRVRIKTKRNNRRLLIKQVIIGIVTLGLMVLYIIYLGK